MVVGLAKAFKMLPSEVLDRCTTYDLRVLAIASMGAPDDGE